MLSGMSGLIRGFSTPSFDIYVEGNYVLHMSHSISKKLK